MLVYPRQLVPQPVVGITAAGIVYAWTFNRTGGSLLPVAIRRAEENTESGCPHPK